MRKKVALAFLFSVIPGLAACTAILGGFEVSPATSGTDGGGDGPITTDEGGSDAGDPDANDGGPGLLRCQLAGTPRTIDKNLGASFDRGIKAFRVGTKSTRVIARKPPNGTPSGFIVYTFDSDNGQIQQKFQAMQRQIMDVRPIPGGIGVLTVEDNMGGPVSNVVLYTISDADPQGNAVRVVLSADEPNTTFTNETRGAFAPFAANDYFYAVSVGVGGGNNEIRVGRKTTAGPGGFKTVASGPTDGATRVGGIVPANSKAFVFNDKGPEQGSNQGGGYWELPDDPALAVANTPLKVLTKVGGPPVVTFSAAGGPTGMRLAAAEVNFGAGTGVLRIGALSNADLSPSIDVSKLPVAVNLASFFDAPIEGGDSRFSGTDFLAIGSPLGGKGLNFFWYDISVNKVRGVQIGDTGKLLPTQTVESSTFSIGSLLGGIATLDIVWTEAANPPSVADGVMYAQTLNCAK